MDLKLCKQLETARKNHNWSRTQLSLKMRLSGYKLSDRQIAALERDEPVIVSLECLKALFTILKLNSNIMFNDTSSSTLKTQAESSLRELAERGEDDTILSIIKQSLNYQKNL